MITTGHIHRLLQNDEMYPSHHLLNLLLVKHGGRKAYLLETAEFENENEKEVLELPKRMGLVIQKDVTSVPNFPRYWIVRERLKMVPKDDDEIGALLGFKDSGGDFGDSKHDRVELKIYSPMIGSSIVTVEMVQGGPKDPANLAHARGKVKAFNDVMKHLGLPYRFRHKFTQLDGSLTRLDKLRELDEVYIRKHIHDYVNMDLSDTVHDWPRLRDPVRKWLRNKDMLRQHLPFFEYMYAVLHGDLEDPNVDQTLARIQSSLEGKSGKSGSGSTKANKKSGTRKVGKKRTVSKRRK